MAALFLCARARVWAQSQFSAPYDPDFAAPASEGRPEPRRRPAPETAPEPGTTPVSPETGEPLPPVLIAPGRRFLLIERRDPKRILERLDEGAEPGAPAEELDFVEFQQRLKGPRYSAERYSETRRKLEQGIDLEELERGPDGPLAPTSVAISTEAVPRPPPPEVELPTYGTSLSITGRKVIGFNFSEKRFLSAQTKTGRVATTNLIEINQQLQLRMQGKVGPKITVNVDYDDTKTNHQDISVVYTGDPNEVVQNVSFGDIDLTLPATEFVSYNKQLFGIRADVKWRGLRGTFIGSRTKGTTKSRQFNGNTQYVTTDLQDISYVRRSYYDVAFGNAARLPIRQGSEQVFLARQIPGQVNVTDVTLSPNDLAVQSSSFTAVYTPLNAGVDYTIDYVKGILTFRSGLLPQYAVAIDYVDANGIQLSVQTSTTGVGSTSPCVPNGTTCINAPRLVKTPNDLPLNVESTTSTAQVGWNREMKTFYNIGQTQIVRDNGRGNFILQVLNQQRTEVGSSLNPQQKYPDTIEVDFENGVFRLKAPFAVEGDSATADPDIYAPTPISKRIIHLEYSFRFKTFFLEPNLVLQSEIVILDGVRLNRNVDYFIDYEAGFITFFNEDRIHAQSTIDIAYEVAPFAGITDESLLGTRVSYDITDKFAVGTTLLYQSGAKSQTTPSITELARSLMVYDFDAKLHDLKLGRRLKLTSFAGEFAQSRQSLNLNDYALVDNMEGIKQEDTASTLSQLWFIGSQVPGSAPASLGPVHPGHLSWLTEDVRVLDINPRAQASQNETQKVLTLNYNTLADDEQVSIVFPFSIAGVDMSRKTVLEVVMLGDNSQNEINFRLGGIPEDADGDGVMDTEDVNLDTILQPAEDVGWQYNPTVGPANGQVAFFGSANGRIDSEDLNSNGRLDPDDANGNNFGFGPDLTLSNPDNDELPSLNSTTPHPDGLINFGAGAAGNDAGWQTFQIPLDVSTATLSRWTNIRSIQVTVRKTPAGLAAGSLKFARIAAVGNTWLPGEARDSSTGAGPVGGEELVVTPVNSVDNPTYTPIFNAAGDASQVFSDLYGSLTQLQRQSNSRNLSEQALQLDFTGMDGAFPPGPVRTVETRRQFSRAVDISQHRFFNFLLFSNADSANIDTTDHVFFLRAGNETNFFEVRVPLSYTGWRKIRIEQTDTNGDSVMDTWRVADGNPTGTVVVSSGAPSLQQVASLIAGVQQVDDLDGTTTGRVFVNEIHLAEPVTRVGNAHKLSADFEYTGWATFGAKYRLIDRNFQTPTSVVANQDNRQDSAYLNLTRLSYLPMTFNLQRVITETPSTVQTGQLTNTINLLLQGRVVTWTGSAQGNFALGSYPRVSLAHTRNRIEYDLLTRLDDRKSYNLTMQYGVPSQSRFLPRTIDVNAGLMNYDVSFKNLQARLLPGNFNTNERTHNGGIRLTFTPWNGSTFNPAYSLTRVDEKRREIADTLTGRETELSYTKSRTQNVGLSSNFRITSWFNPQLNYSLDTLENNILSTTTLVVQNSTPSVRTFLPGEIKTINRTANGSISLPLPLGEIFPRSKLFRSFTFVNGYQLQDGDVYNNVESSLSSLPKLWIRSGLRPANPAAVKTSQTFRDTYNSTQRWSPLEAYSIGGRLAAFKTFSISNNFVRSVQRSEVTGTPSKTITTTLPDLVASIGQLEQLLRTERFMSNTQMNYKYQARRTENVGQTITDESSFGTDIRSIVRRRFDTVVSFNRRNSTNRNLLVAANTQETDHEDATVQVTFDVGKFRMTPKTDYSRDVSKLGTGVKTQDLTLITPSVLIRGDLSLPRGLVLPGTTRTLLFTNRVIWTTTISLQNRKSPVTVADNSRLASMTTSADYEIAKNLRMTLNGALARLWHRFLPEENFISYQFGTTLTFQF